MQYILGQFTKNRAIAKLMEIHLTIRNSKFYQHWLSILINCYIPRNQFCD